MGDCSFLLAFTVSNLSVMTCGEVSVLYTDSEPLLSAMVQIGDILIAVTGVSFTKGLKCRVFLSTADDKIKSMRGIFFTKSLYLVYL